MTDFLSGFRHWRKTRPFWGGLFTIIGGLYLLQWLVAPLPFITALSTNGGSTWALGGVLIVGGLFFWFSPAQRHFIAIVCAIASVASFLASNFGGFGFGMIFGLLGSAMAFGWQPYSGKESVESNGGQAGA